eukprot:jgi/Mesen1/7441/ME000389S06785
MVREARLELPTKGGKDGKGRPPGGGLRSKSYAMAKPDRLLSTSEYRKRKALYENAKKVSKYKKLMKKLRPDEDSGKSARSHSRLYDLPGDDADPFGNDPKPMPSSEEEHGEGGDVYESEGDGAGEGGELLNEPEEPEEREGALRLDVSTQEGRRKGTHEEDGDDAELASRIVEGSRSRASSRAARWREAEEGGGALELAEGVGGEEEEDEGREGREGREEPGGKRRRRRRSGKGGAADAAAEAPAAPAGAAAGAAPPARRGAGGDLRREGRGEARKGGSSRAGGGLRHGHEESELGSNRRMAMVQGDGQGHGRAAGAYGDDERSAREKPIVARAKGDYEDDAEEDHDGSVGRRGRRAAEEVGAGEVEGGEVAGEGGGRRRRQKPMNQLQRMRQEVEAKKAEEERARAARVAAAAAQQRAREEAERARKEVKLKMWKKTARGQPVMKHRIDYLLAKIERDVQYDMRRT